MLKRITSQPAIPIGQADPRSLFKDTLEYSCPARGSWNIVHTGMLVPGAHQIYICAAGCLRGVVLTAAEMGEDYRRRFSSIEVREHDTILQNNERLIIEGVSDILTRLPALPPIVLIFTACFHHFMGCDLRYVYRELTRRFPAVRFAECIMDPIRKKALSPEARLRREIVRLFLEEADIKAGNCDYTPQSLSSPTTQRKALLVHSGIRGGGPSRRDGGRVLPPFASNLASQAQPPQEKTLVIFGSNLPLDAESEPMHLARKAGFTVRDLAALKSTEEFFSLGGASLFIYQHPASAAAARLLERHGKNALYLPQVWTFEGIKAALENLARALALGAQDFSHEEEAARTALLALKEKIGETPLALDFTFTLRPLSLARLLVDFGFNLQRLYIDAAAPKERGDFLYLRERAPHILLLPTKHPAMRLAAPPMPCLALGQKAAYFTGTRRFVNIVDGAGLWGFSGLKKLAALIAAACAEERAPRPLITRKGWGGPCAL